MVRYGVLEMGKLTVGEEHIGRWGPLRGILVGLPEQSYVSVQSLPISPQWLGDFSKGKFTLGCRRYFRFVTIMVTGSRPSPF